MRDHQIKITPGKTSPLGATRMNNGINFAIHAHGLKRLFLLIYGDKSKKPIEFEMNGVENSTGDIWHIHLSNIEDPIEYAYKITTAANKEYIISDPYATVLTGAETWGTPAKREFHSVSVQPDFDWENDTPPRTHLADSVIYEMHVRGFTRHSSAGVESAGRFAGLIEKIPYLKEWELQW